MQGQVTAAFVIHILLSILALPAALSSGYLLLFTFLSQRLPVLRSKSRQLRFDVIVPAHNEAAVISRTVASLRKIDWPAERYRILVCADNCTDDTAARAREAGAAAIERQNPALRGKGYALDFAFESSRTTGFADAVVIIDADAEVSANLLEAIAARLENGAQAVQVHYGVLNPMASWRTRLITIAKGAVHVVRSRARERLGLSCGIRGTGWCVTHQLLQAVPYRAFSLTEDVEYGIELGLAGFRVAYADEADCDAEMVSNEQSARTQRQRWERGRFQLMRSKTGPLLKAAWNRRSMLCLDLACDLLVLPISYVALIVAFMIVAAALAAPWFPGMQVWLWLSTACAASLACYVLRGWQLSTIGLVGVLDLARAPGFMLWKLQLLLRSQKSKGWERTDRERP
jgi:cellulose synthase/poly-beta-1,6-N-acetylglucosamine synthase-like glycosyltransferase